MIQAEAPKVSPIGDKRQGDHDVNWGEALLLAQVSEQSDTNPKRYFYFPVW